ncbi:MAG: hypothetical protein RIQ89_2325 [Bacteroidota bacterium]|jgi:glycosyltransferase involved in cell wall biosynthesis
MKIAVNARLLKSKKLDGIGKYTAAILSRVAAANPQHTFYYLFESKPDPDFLTTANIVPVVLYPSVKHPLLMEVWLHLVLPIYLKFLKPHLFISTDGYLPSRLSIPSILVIHDLNFLHLDNVIGPWQKTNERNFLRGAKEATRLITVSEFSKADIALQYNINPDAISVITNGTTHIAVKAMESETVLEKYSQGKPYFIFIGTIYERKNVHRLIAAFSIFKNRYRTNHQLLLIGKRIFGEKLVDAAYSQSEHKDDIIFAGRLSDDETHQLLAHAVALTYVSLFEGFGIPLLEAMQVGTPVITSNTTSLPEVAGDAALYVDPLNIPQIADALHIITTNVELKNRLIQNGKKRLEKFSWETSAQRMSDEIKALISC